MLMDQDKISWLGNLMDAVILTVGPNPVRSTFTFSNTSNGFELLQINGVPLNESPFPRALTLSEWMAQTLSEFAKLSGSELGGWDMSHIEVTISPDHTVDLEWSGLGIIPTSSNITDEMIWPPRLFNEWATIQESALTKQNNFTQKFQGMEINADQTQGVLRITQKSKGMFGSEKLKTVHETPLEYIGSWSPETYMWRWAWDDDHLTQDELNDVGHLRYDGQEKKLMLFLCAWMWMDENLVSLTKDLCLSSMDVQGIATVLDPDGKTERYFAVR